MAAFFPENTQDPARYTWQQSVELCCLLDDVYFQLFYTWNTVARGYQQSGSFPVSTTQFSSIWEPVEYLSHMGRIMDKISGMTSSLARQKYLSEVVALSGSEIAQLYEVLWKGEDALVKIYLLRFTETIRFIPVEECELPERVPRGNSQSREPPCHPVLRMWRDCCRDWVCHLYAYAVPNEMALQAIANLQSTLIEIGAGTGYWGYLLANFGQQKMYLFDSFPLPSAPQPEESKSSRKSNTGMNDYHGKALAFVPVKRGGSTDLRIISKETAGSTALMLCYPPPGCSMALDCLKNFQGEWIVYIGEWQGDTATPDFEKSLLQQFSLFQSVGLPNWGNTCYSLTIWKRKALKEDVPPVTPKTSPLIDILLGGIPPFQCTSCGLSKRTLKRCTCCSLVSYCGQECCTRHLEVHQQLHKFQSMHTPPIPWSSPLFEKLSTTQSSTPP